MGKHNSVQYQLRLPAELREWLRIKAHENWCSMNTEIVKILTNARNADNKKADATVESSSALETTI